MKQYLELLEVVLNNGVETTDRTGVGTISVFGTQTRYNLQDGFPAVTTKKLAWRSVVSELLWFLEGSMDERRLAEIHYGKPREELIGKTTIWTANADAQGKDLGWVNTDLIKNLGPIYGSQWMGKWKSGPNQIGQLIQDIVNNPDSRRLIVSAWNPKQIPQMALPPCHTMFQMKVYGGKLSCQLYQRSGDLFLGVPFNIASYALLTHIIAKICNLDVGEFIHTMGDAHIYKNHIDQVREQLSRTPKKHPTLRLPEFTSIDELPKDPSLYELVGYDSHSTIKADMAV